LTSLATDVARTIGSLGMRAAILLGTALAIAPTPGFAEMQVRGSPEAVRIEARDAPVEEILAALSRAFGMHYQLSTNLDKRVSGTYVGSLRRVLTRILDGYNFVLKTENGSTVVTVLGTPSATAAAPVSSGPKVVRQPAGAAPPAVVENLPRPAASTAAPSPAVELAQVPASPTPVLPESGAAPSPVPEVAESGAPAPAPLAPGSKPSPTPELTPSTGAAPPVPAPTRLLAPQRAQ
jgi:hypothetical protein